MTLSSDVMGSATCSRRAVLFDLDGTLVDSLRDIADAANEVLARRGWPSLPLSVYRRAVGEGVRRLLERLAEHVPEAASLEEAQVEALVRAFRAAYAERLLRHTRPFDGVRELLRELAARGVPTGVLSNKPHAATRKVVAALFPEHAFAVVLGQRDGVPRKPDPTGALEAARALGVLPEHILFVGDTPVDVATARAAGMTPLGVGWGFRSPEALRDAGACAVLHRADELLQWLALGS